MDFKILKAVMLAFAIGQCLLPFSLHFCPHATLSSFKARQGIFVRDTLGLVLGKCCKVRHSVTKPKKQLQN